MYGLLRLQTVFLVLALLAPPHAQADFEDDEFFNERLGVSKARYGAVERETVRYDGGQAPGTIIVDTSERRLYYVLPNRRAIRYGVGVGREGFEWSGTSSVSRKAEWPSWTPPAEMHARHPGLPKFMPGGPDNPMGARALYLGASLYRIHGTNNKRSIGRAMSSGCIRMMNADVIDLYRRVRVGTRVIVR
ncbi:MAG: L,D-transpeptidase [Hyphomicrobiales bacterium]